MISNGEIQLLITVIVYDCGVSQQLEIALNHQWLMNQTNGCSELQTGVKPCFQWKQNIKKLNPRFVNHWNQQVGSITSNQQCSGYVHSGLRPTRRIAVDVSMISPRCFNPERLVLQNERMNDGTSNQEGAWRDLEDVRGSIIVFKYLKFHQEMSSI